MHWALSTQPPPRPKLGNPHSMLSPGIDKGHNETPPILKGVLVCVLHLSVHLMYVPHYYVIIFFFATPQENKPYYVQYTTSNNICININTFFFKYIQKAPGFSARIIIQGRTFCFPLSSSFNSFASLSKGTILCVLTQRLLYWRRQDFWANTHRIELQEMLPSLLSPSPPTLSHVILE